MTLTARIRKLESQIIRLRRRVYVLEARRTGPPISEWTCTTCNQPHGYCTCQRYRRSK